MYTNNRVCSKKSGSSAGHTLHLRFGNDAKNCILRLRKEKTLFMSIENCPHSDGFKIQFKPDSMVERIVSAEFILDFNSNGRMIAIEILHLKFFAGPKCLKNLSKDIAHGTVPMRYSYDDDVDAIWLFLTEDKHSADSKAVDGNIMLDAEGHIIGFQAEFEAGDNSNDDT